MKICLVKTSSLGDILHTFPVLSYLRHRFPSAKIDWLVERPYAGLVRAHPNVDGVLEVDTKEWRRHPLSRKTWTRLFAARKALRQEHYDLLFDLQGNIKSGLLTAQMRCPAKVGPNWRSAAEWLHPAFTHHHLPLQIGENIQTALLTLVQSYFHDQEPFKDKDTPVTLKLSPEEKAEVIQLFEELPPSSPTHLRILVAPGSIWKNKQLTPSQLLNFLQRVRELKAATFLFSWGSQEERDQASLLAAALQGAQLTLKCYTLPQLSSIIQQMDLLIGMDSLPLHLAAATSQTATFAFFGPSAARVYNPVGPHHGAFQGNCPYGMQIISRCPKLRRCPTGACLREVNGETLFNAFVNGVYSVVLKKVAARSS